MTNQNKKRILRLTIHKKAFEVMVTGEKTSEYRHYSAWIRSRIGQYDIVEFINGYGNHRPRFTVEFIKWQFVTNNEIKKYSNGLIVKLTTNMIEIQLGKVLEIHNYSIPEKQSSNLGHIDESIFDNTGFH